MLTCGSYSCCIVPALHLVVVLVCPDCHYFAGGVKCLLSVPLIPSLSLSVVRYISMPSSMSVP